MSTTAGHYRICVKGRLDPNWSDWFGGFVISCDEQGETHLSGTISDPSALYGILNRLAALGLALISVNPNQTGEQEVRHG